MKNILLILVLLATSFGLVKVANAQTTTQNSQSLDSLGTKVMKLMEFYESYDDGSPESLKKAKYNDAVDEISNGTATKKDKEDAFQIIDAYIKGDKALEQDKPQQTEDEQSFDEVLKNTEEVKASLEFLDQQKTMFMQMPYPDFEAYILKINPVAGKKDIKTAYNEMHKNDGKQVSITETDEEMTEVQRQVWAFDALQNPENYEEFRKAYKILQPDAKESEIREVWGKKISVEQRVVQRKN